jgi:hypothetical protein
MNLNISHSMPPGYYPVYPSEYQYYPNSVNSTPNTPMSSSAPSFINTFHSAPVIPTAPPSTPILSTPPKQIINAPPASHYIHRE